MYDKDDDSSDLARLEKYKKNVRIANEYFKDNYKRFDEFRRFVFETSLNSSERNLLNSIGKPTLEFNILEAFISRLLGEFAKQEPSISVSAYDPSSTDPQTIDIVEQHLRHVMCDADNHGTQYEVYKDVLTGGFSTFKLRTDYINPMSFDQDIYFDRVEPTLCGFDPMAKESHKGDGLFCFELVPMEKERFEELYPEVNINTVSFRRDLSGFNWSYINNNQKIVLICDYYTKKTKRMKIVKTTEGRVMSMSDYNKIIKEWSYFTQPPAIVGKPRMTEIETIHRCRFIENRILEEEETDFPIFPIIFVDGNSELLKDENNSNIHQMTRPYIYQAKGAQRLKNFAGNSLANEIENVVQHKFMVAKEALPKEEEFLQAYKDVQRASVMVYNSFYENDPNQVIANPIREIGKVPAPPEIVQAFSGSDSLIQTILGSFDASLGINDNQLSGVAIVEGATQSNAAAMPYVVGYLAGLQRVAEGYVKLFPKYYKTPRTIPVQDKEGKRSFAIINQQGAPQISYDENALGVKVVAGVNFRVQQSRALAQITALASSMPQFAQFINDVGLPILLDNIEIRGVDRLKELSGEWMKQQQIKQQQMMQMQQQMQQNNPMAMKNQIEMQKLQQSAMESQSQFKIDMAKLQHDQNQLIADIEESHEQNQVQLVKAQTEQFSKRVDLELKHKNHELDKQDQMHRHAKDAVQLHHSIKNQEASNGAQSVME